MGARRHPLSTDRIAPGRLPGFFGWLMGGYLGLVLLWPVLGGSYRAVLAGTGDVVLPLTSPGLDVVVKRETPASSALFARDPDLLVLVRAKDAAEADGRPRYVIAKPVSTFYQAYTGTAVLGALFLASPIRRRTRLFRGAVACLAWHAFLLACVRVDVAHTALESGIGSASGGDVWRPTLALLHMRLTSWAAGPFLMPLVIWAAVCWRPLAAAWAGGGNLGALRQRRRDRAHPVQG